MDASFSLDKAGRLTLSRDVNGSPFLDERAVYAVFATLAAHKGGYGWDGTVGTDLHTIRKDGRLTGTRLRGITVDLFDQLKSDELVRSGDGSAERLRTGAWVLSLAWTTKGGIPTAQKVSL